MDNMLDISREAFKDDALTRLSSVLHETQNATKRGLNSAVPASIAALAEHAKRARNAEALLGTFHAGDYPHVAPTELRRLVDDPMRTAKLAASGEGFLAGIFGPKLDDMVELVARQAGISRTSAHILLGLSAPLVLDALSKEAELRHLDAGGLSRFLNEQEARAAAEVPTAVAGAVAASSGAAGASVIDVLNRQGQGATVTHLRERQRPRAIEEQIRAQRTEAARSVPISILWILGAVFLFALLTWLLLQVWPTQSPQPSGQAAQGSRVSAVPASPAPDPAVGENAPSAEQAQATAGEAKAGEARAGETTEGQARAGEASRAALPAGANTAGAADDIAAGAGTTGSAPRSATESRPSASSETTRSSTELSPSAAGSPSTQAAAASAVVQKAEQATAGAATATQAATDPAASNPALTQQELEADVRKAESTPAAAPSGQVSAQGAQPVVPEELRRLGTLAATETTSAVEPPMELDGVRESQRTAPTPALSGKALPGFLAGGALPPRRFILREVPFASGSASVPGTNRVLDRAASALEANPGARVMVQGYADARGDAPYNQRVSEERAKAVKRYLVERGVAADRLTTRGLADTRPLASEATAEGRARNRRVELVVLTR